MCHRPGCKRIPVGMGVDRVEEDGDPLLVQASTSRFMPTVPPSRSSGREVAKRRVAPFHVLLHIGDGHQLDCVCPESVHGSRAGR